MGNNNEAWGVVEIIQVRFSGGKERGRKGETGEAGEMTQDENYKNWGVVGCGKKGKGEKGRTLLDFCLR